MRPYDNAARWGGDEFLIVLTPCDSATLATLGERIRSAAAASAPLADGRVLTVSIGAYLVKPGDSVEIALQRADDALYAAKDAGRNAFRMRA
jgi:diguanylate cyclase (GGDEF)-like protein